MEGPQLQTFQKETIVNPLFQQKSSIHNLDLLTHYINKEDFSLNELNIINTKDNFGYYIFQIFHSPDFSKTKINDIISYISNLTKLKTKEYVLDLTVKLNFKEFDKDLIYIIDSSKTKNHESDEIFNSIEHLILNEMLNHVGGIIYISQRLDNTCKLLSSRSQLIFLDKNSKEISDFCKLSAGINLRKKNKIDFDCICLNKMGLWNNIYIFNKFSK